jgi:hypothetical protein
MSQNSTNLNDVEYLLGEIQMKMNTKKKNMKITNEMISGFLNRATAEKMASDSSVTFNLEGDDEKAYLDSVVLEANIPHYICSTNSKHIKHSDKHISDYYASSIDGRFVFSAIAGKVLSMGYGDIENLTTQEIAEIYHQNQLYNYDMKNYVTEPARARHWGSRPHCELIIEWRWNNGVMFGNYRDRVLTYLKLHVFPEMENELTDYCESILNVQRVINILEEDIDILMDAEVFTNLNPITKTVLKSVRHDRLSLDRKALQELAKASKKKN